MQTLWWKKLGDSFTFHQASTSVRTVELELSMQASDQAVLICNKQVHTSLEAFCTSGVRSGGFETRDPLATCNHRNNLNTTLNMRRLVRAPNAIGVTMKLAAGIIDATMINLKSRVQLGIRLRTNSLVLPEYPMVARNP